MGWGPGCTDLLEESMFCYTDEHVTYESLLLMDDYDLTTLGFKLGSQNLLLHCISSQKAGKSDIVMKLVRCTMYMHSVFSVAIWTVHGS